MGWRPFKKPTSCGEGSHPHRVESKWSLYKISVPLPYRYWHQNHFLTIISLQTLSNGQLKFLYSTFKTTVLFEYTKPYYRIAIDWISNNRNLKNDECHNITFTRVLCCQCQRGNPKGISTR